MERGEARGEGRLRRVSRFCHAKRESRTRLCLFHPIIYTFFPFLLLFISLPANSPHVDPSIFGKKKTDPRYKSSIAKI